MKSYLEDNYDLMCFNSKEVNEVKLVRMMGSRLMIVMFENNEIQNREIDTARKLNIPILFIYNSLYVQKIYPVNKGEHKIVFNNLEDVAMILKDKFKLIKKIKKQKNLPFQILEENKPKLYQSKKIKSISILKENNKLLLAGDKIQYYDLNENTLVPLKSHEFNEGQLNVCVNNKGKEIIILNNRVISKYNFDFDKISEDKILEIDDNVVINEIFVNEVNKHVYGISDDSFKLYQFDEEFKLEHTMEITTPLLIKVLNNNLYMLLQTYRNLNIERKKTSQIIENEKSFIGKYSQRGNEVIKFKRKIILDVLVAPLDFHVDEKYILIFSRYMNKHYLFDFNLHLFLYNHDGIFLQKTGLGILCFTGTRFFVVDYENIYYANFKVKSDSVIKRFKMRPEEKHENI
jgi:hypothetical protein